MSDSRMAARLKQYRIEREIEGAWRKLIPGCRYRHIERGWTGIFQGEPSDSFTAWMNFDGVGQAGVDPRKLRRLGSMRSTKAGNSSKTDSGSSVTVRGE